MDKQKSTFSKIGRIFLRNLKSFLEENNNKLEKVTSSLATFLLFGVKLHFLRVTYEQKLVLVGSAARESWGKVVAAFLLNKREMPLASSARKC